jgi:hypothetical protein
MAEGNLGATAKKRPVTPKGERVTQPPVTPAIVGKAGLCEALSWTRPKLDRRLDSDGGFPIAKRGTRAGGWEFDVESVREYLAGARRQVAEKPAPASRTAEPVAEAKSPTGARIDSRADTGNKYPGAKFTSVPPAGMEPVVHTGEQTARQRRETVQAEILEDKLRRDRGELVQVEAMRQVLNTMLAHLGKGLDRLSDIVVERLGLPEESAPDIRQITDDLRRTMAEELRSLLG